MAGGQPADVAVGDRAPRRDRARLPPRCARRWRSSRRLAFGSSGVTAPDASRPRPGLRRRRTTTPSASWKKNAGAGRATRGCSQRNPPATGARRPSCRPRPSDSQAQRFSLVGRLVGTRCRAADGSAGDDDRRTRPVALTVMPANAGPKLPALPRSSARGCGRRRRGVSAIGGHAVAGCDRRRGRRCRRPAPAGSSRTGAAGPTSGVPGRRSPRSGRTGREAVGGGRPRHELGDALGAGRRDGEGVEADSAMQLRREQRRRRRSSARPSARSDPR